MVYILFLVLGVAFAWLTVRRGSLTVGGAVAAFLLGAGTWYTKGAFWLLPLFVFFLSSVLLERLFPARSTASDEKDKQPRDAVQVLCNGGMYGAILLIGGPEILLLIAMSVATSDTWASQLGKYVRQATYDILRLSRVPPGLSGGVSVAGTLGGAAGAALVAMLGYFLIDDFATHDLIFATVFGAIGMLVDSVLGAAFQARYHDPVTAALSDRGTGEGSLVSGYTWMTNDLVNLLSIATTVGLAAAFA